MPTVPILNPVTTALRPVRGTTIDARMSPDAAGAGLGDGLQRLGVDAGRIYQEARDHANQARVLEADTQDAAADLAARNELVQAPDALTALDEISKRRQQEQDAIAKGLANPDQRDAYKARATARAQSFQAFGNGYVIRQQQENDTKAINGRLELARQAAVSRRDDAAGAMQEIAAATTELESYGKRNGMPIEALQAMKQHFLSSTALSLVIALSDDQNDAAAAHTFELNRHLMTPDDLHQAARMVESGSIQGSAQREAARIWAPEKTLEEMSAEADKIADQRVQAAAKDRLANQYSLHQRSLEDGQRKAENDAWALVNTDPRGLSAVSAAQQIIMGPERWTRIQSAYARAVRGEAVTTEEGNAYFIRMRSALSGAMGEEERQRALAEDPNAGLAILSLADRRALADLRDKAATGKDLSGVRDVEEIATQTLALNGEDPLPLQKDGRRPNPHAIRFRLQLQALVDSARRDGKDPTRSEIQRMASSLMAPGPDRKPLYLLGFDASKPATALDLIPTTLDDFDAGAVAQARTAVRASGAIPTDAATLQYLRAKRPAQVTPPRVDPNHPKWWNN